MHSCGRWLLNQSGLCVQLTYGVPDKSQGDEAGVTEESAWAEFTSFQVRRSTIPHRQRVAGRSVGEESSEPTPFIPHIKMNAATNASTESEPVDVDGIRRVKFHQRNVHGHSSDSSVARLLYGHAAVETESDAADVIETGPVIIVFMQFDVCIQSNIMNYLSVHMRRFSQPMYTMVIVYIVVVMTVKYSAINCLISSLCVLH